MTVLGSAGGVCSYSQRCYPGHETLSFKVATEGEDRSTPSSPRDDESLVTVDKDPWPNFPMSCIATIHASGRCLDICKGPPVCKRCFVYGSTMKGQEQRFGIHALPGAVSLVFPPCVYRGSKWLGGASACHSPGPTDTVLMGAGPVSGRLSHQEESSGMHVSRVSHCPRGVLPERLCQIIPRFHRSLHISNITKALQDIAGILRASFDWKGISEKLQYNSQFEDIYIVFPSPAL